MAEKTRAEFTELGYVRDIMPGRVKDSVCARICSCTK